MTALTEDEIMDREYHGMVHPLAEDRGCGCRCPECYNRDALPKCVCPECTQKGHPDF